MRHRLRRLRRWTSVAVVIGLATVTIFVKGGPKLDHGGGGKPDHPAGG